MDGTSSRRARCITCGADYYTSASLRPGLSIYGSGHHPGIVSAAMYVHFLDAAWIVLFAVLVVAA